MVDMAQGPYPVGYEAAGAAFHPLVDTDRVGLKEPIDLLKGWPHQHLLPLSEIEHACTKTFKELAIPKTGLNYGPYAGPQRLRELIAQWLYEFYHPVSEIRPIPAERICVTGGASQNLACILQVFSDPYYTRNVWMVSPTYFLACRIFEDSGFAGKLRPVPEDEEGLDVEYLRKEIRESEENATFLEVDKELVQFYN